jgi:hypothetical protein
MAALLQAEWLLRCYPFGKIAEQLRKPIEPNRSTDALRIALEVRGALASACRRLPWNPTCLVKALAAQTMLRRRGIPAALVLSVAPNESITVKAHAWLEAAGTVVTGRREMQNYIPLYRFENCPGVPSDQSTRAVAPCSR